MAKIGDRKKQCVTIYPSHTFTDAAVTFQLMRAPDYISLESITVVDTDSGLIDNVATAIWSFENWDTGGSAAKSTGGSVMSAANLGGTVFTEKVPIRGTAFVYRDMAPGEYLTALYSPQATNAGSAVKPCIMVEFMLGGGRD